MQHTEGLGAKGAFMTIGAALQSAGIPDVLNICGRGNNKLWKQEPKVGNLWRKTGDIYDCFDCIETNGDGYIGLFVGGRVIPERSPEFPAAQGWQRQVQGCHCFRSYCFTNYRYGI